MKLLTTLLLWCTTAAFVTAASETATYYIAPAPHGNDAHDGSATAPFATLDRARLAVRALLAKDEMRGDIVVELSGGTYELSAPVKFDAADSGKNGHSVVYRAAPGASIVISGGRRITGWSKREGEVYQTTVGPGTDFRQLWIDGRRAIRAREPNVGHSFTFATEKQADGFDLPLTQLARVALQPAEVEISVLIAWMHKRLRIARIEPTADATITRAVIARGEWDAVVNQPQGNRVYLGREYWFENARGFLDAPGEFFLHRQAGTLFYQPRENETLATADVVRPELENLIVLAGEFDAPVHHLRFEGLTFAYTGWTRPNRVGFVDVQANSLVPADPAAAVDSHYRHAQRKDRIPAAFQAKTADHIVVRGCRFTRLGGTGVMFTGGGNDNVIEGNAFFDLSGGGIEFGEDSAAPATPRLFPRRNRIANNFIAHIGEEYFGSVPILGYYTDASLITHNEITAVPYTGLSQGWGWGNPAGPADARANRITHNFVSNYMRRLDDGGGIYTTDRQLGSEIAHNVVQHMRQPKAHTDAGGALYLDQFTEGYHVHHNVASDAIRWLFIWNANIRGNRVETNYADTAAWRNDGTDNVVAPAQLFDPAQTSMSSQEPSELATIFAHAGLEPEFRSIRELPAPTDVIVESHSVDFWLATGEWKPAPTAAETDGGFRWQTMTPGASARWTPILPRSGPYEVRVWRATGDRAATYTLRHATSESVIPAPAATKSGWVSLGQREFKAGMFGHLTVQADDAKDGIVSAGAVRFIYVGK